jgi:hypothetical protein
MAESPMIPKPRVLSAEYKARHAERQRLKYATDAAYREYERAAGRATYYRQTPEQRAAARARAAKWRAEHPEHLKAYYRAYYRKNRT